MLNLIEQELIIKYVVKDKQERYLNFSSNFKTRKKLTAQLYHFKDFNWNLFQKIKGSENERDAILYKLCGKKRIKSCQVISVDSNFDSRTFPVEVAINNIVGVEGTILIFGDAEIVYYEGEAPDSRFLSI